MEFDWWNTIQAREKLPNVHVVQWLGMYVVEWKLVGGCVVSKGAEKILFKF